MRLEFAMSSHGHGIPAVELLRAVGYQDAALGERRFQRGKECVVSVTASEPQAVDEVRQLVHVVDPEAEAFR
jgi:hypothetical protein